jgi:hypothetical protein
MDAGVVAEIGPPCTLLANPSSAFSKLVDATGASGAAALRKMAADFMEERARGQVGAGVGKGMDVWVGMDGCAQQASCSCSRRLGLAAWCLLH